MNPPIRVAALLTCHNRRNKTVKCLEALYRQKLSEPIQLSVYLVDDGSTDGTSDAVRESFPQVNLLQGDGQLYWNQGMHRAFAEAMNYDHDFYLWLNDDTNLFDNTIEILLTAFRGLQQKGENKAIVVGSTCDPVTQNLTYGGLCRSSRWHPLKFSRIQPGSALQPCETMNGNCVLIPRTVAHQVGNLDPQFSHRYGDIDYGLRARKAGFSLWIAPGYVGTCSLNQPKSAKAQAKQLQSPIGLPIKEQRVFAQRHAGLFWLFFMILPYIRIYSRQFLPLS
jgi:GT2 family glycosyltransferase